MTTPERGDRSLSGLFRHAVNYSTVPVLQKLAAVLMTPFYTSWLVTEEYGVVGLTDFILVGLAELLGINLLSGMVRFFFDQVDERDREAVVSSCTILTTILAWSVCGLAIVFREPLTPILLARGDDQVGRDVLQSLLLLTFLLLPFQLTTQAGFSYLQIQKRSGRLASIRIAKLFGEIGLKVWFLGVLGWGVKGYFLSVLIGEAATTLFVTGSVIARVGLRFDWRVLRPIIGYTLPLVPVGLCQLALHQLDKRLLEHLSPAEQALGFVGIYTLGYQVGYLVNAMVLTPFVQIWQPWIYSIDDPEERASQVARVSTYAVMSIAAATLVVITFGREAVDFLGSKPEYDAAYRVVPWVASGYVFWALYYTTQIPLFIAKRTLPLLAINAVAVGVNVVLNVVLVPRMGYVGAGVATTCTFACLAVLGIVGSRSETQVPFELGRILAILFAVLVAGTTALWLDERHTAAGWSLLLTVPLKSAVLAILLGYLGLAVLSPIERGALGRWIGLARRPSPDEPFQAPRGAPVSLRPREDRAPFHPRSVIAMDPDEPPVLLVLLAVEEEFDWEAEFDRRATMVSAIHELERIQSLFDEYGVRPTYAVDYPVASDPEAAGVLRSLADGGRCVVGAHLHPWVNPPHEETLSVRNSYPGNLPAKLERAKLEALARTIEANIGRRPRCYLAGRYGFGPRTAGILRETGFEIDVSATPPFDYSSEHGPDYSSFPAAPYWIDDEKRLLGVPITGGYVGYWRTATHGVYRLANSHALRRAHMPGLLARAGAIDRLRLSPEGFRPSDHAKLTRALLARGVRVFTWYFHSPSLKPGCTEYVRDERDLRELYDSCRRYFDWFLGELGGEALTHFELRARIDSRREG